MSRPASECPWKSTNAPNVFCDCTMTYYPATDTRCDQYRFCLGTNCARRVPPDVPPSYNANGDTRNATIA